VPRSQIAREPRVQCQRQETGGRRDSMAPDHYRAICSGEAGLKMLITRS
jgi:hypothetical protein